MTINYTPTTGVAGLGNFAVSITDANGVPYPDGSGSYPAQTRTFPIDTSFEPYRREAFRHRSIPAQREAIQMTNIMGEGTVNTEGLWRREQREWNQGAGQQYLDHKDDDQPGRFYSSKGVDVFNYPYQATLLPDTVACVSLSSTNTNAKTVAANGYMMVAYSYSGTVYTTWYNGISSPYVAWIGGTLISTWTGGTTPTIFYDITTANSYVYIATNTGIWFTQPGSGATWTCFASGTYTMVAWANDQLIASNGATLFAFQPRSTTTAPLYGSGPSNIVASQSFSYIGNGSLAPSGSSAQVQLQGNNNGFIVGQSVQISNAQSQAIIASLSLTGGVVTATCTSGTYHGFQQGNPITLSLGFSSGTITETATVSAVGSTTTFSWRTKSVTTTTGFVGGTATATTSLYNGNWNISAISGNLLTIQLAGGTTPSVSTYGSLAVGGSIGSNTTPDTLFTHEDPNWVWSGAVGGETQVYFAGYSSNSTTKGNGCIYRSDLLGSSTTTSTGIQSITTSTVAQPWQLVTPVQALPMSPDEYPTCIKSYLNFIFIGTNRGIRMAQTLSIYDPTATATGDLKSGPIIPNILQPITNPVTAIIGDGRFVWFAWSNYDSTSTGLGKLDLSTYIAGDPLAPVYASDIMVTGQGIINSLAWNPVLNLPVITVAGLGVYQPIAQNTNGVMKGLKYVSSGTLTTSIFDYGIPDQKAPVYFEYGGVTSNGSNLAATVTCEPLETYKQTLNTVYYSSGAWSVANFTSPSTIGTAVKEFQLGSASSSYVPQNPKSSQFQVAVTLNAGTNSTANDTTPILYRWTLKSFPNVVSGTNISVVLQLFSVDVVDGVERYVDPYDNFYWLESLRQAQNLVTYTEGPLTASIAIIESLDWIPHKRRDNYENGFEGDVVVSIKTLGPYSYTPQITY